MSTKSSLDDVPRSGEWNGAEIKASMSARFRSDSSR